MSLFVTWKNVQVLVLEFSGDHDHPCCYQRDLPPDKTCFLYLCANESLVLWFFLVASSSLFLSKNENFLYCFTLKYEEAESLDAIEYSPLSLKNDSSSEVSDLDKASFWDSLFNLESEDSEWISDFDPSKCDSSVEDSDFDAASYLDSLLSLEEDWEWLSDSNPESDFQSLSSSADEPLFWPFEEEFDRNFEESWSSFPVSPRKHIKSEPSRPTTRILSESSGKNAALVKRGVPRMKAVSVTKKSPKKNVVSKVEVAKERGYFAVDQELPIETLVGLEEFDGHEGIDAEFKGDIFMLDD